MNSYDICIVAKKKYGTLKKNLLLHPHKKWNSYFIH